MKYRTFPKLPEIKLSQFGFGMMRLPIVDGDYSSIDRTLAGEMLDAAIEAGVNYFDTAHSYHGGDSQKFTGEYLVPKMKDHDIHIATKLPQWEVKTYKDYDRLLNKQLEILGIEQIEFYLIHTLNDESWVKHSKMGVIEFIKGAVKDGRVKYPCFSYHGSIDTFKKIIDRYDDWIMAQIMLNYIDVNWQAGIEGMKYAYAKDVGIVIMEPLKGGMLVNQLPEETKDLFENKNVSPVTAAMNWCYDFIEPTVVLSGVSTMEHTLGQIKIAENAELGKLTDIEKELIKISKDNFNLIPCSACLYCQPCPFDVNIPSLLSLYNNYLILGNEEDMINYQKLAADGKGADQCTQCGECEEACPQKIEIMDKLKLIHEKMMT